MKKNKNLKITIAILLVVLAIGGVSYVSTTGLFSKSVLTSTSRPRECLATGQCLDPIIFTNLPSYPSNFGEITLGVSLSKYPFNENYSIVAPDENYWKQPEFYPEFENEQNLQRWSSVQNVGNGDVKSTSSGVVFGYGMYPGDQVVENIHPGDDWKINSFIHSTWGANMYQGLQLRLVYPLNAHEATNNITVTQSPDDVKNYFSVSINPTVMLLDPNFPVFLQNWAQKVTILIHVNGNTPKGTYAIGIDAANPPIDFSRQEIYKLGIFKYRDAGFIGIERPLLLIFVEVS